MADSPVLRRNSVQKSSGAKFLGGIRFCLWLACFCVAWLAGGPAEPAFEDRERLEAVASIYASLELPGVVRIDAGDTEDRVAEQIREAVGRMLEAGGSRS